MKANYTITEGPAGMLGGKKFNVVFEVELSPDEIELDKQFGVNKRVKVSNRFYGEDSLKVSGVDIIGNIDLERLQSGKIFTLPSVQAANDFAKEVSDGLRRVQRQFIATAECVSALGQKQPVDFN